MWWHSGGCGISVGDVVAQLGMWWLSGDLVAQWQCSNSGFDPGIPHSFLRDGKNNACVS
jgi:hypothetical protein